jgi:glycosyltransferase involved in cell wall biosynthesis
MPFSIGMKRLYKKCKDYKFIVEMSTHPIINEIENEKNVFKKMYFKLSFSALVRYSKFVTLFTLIGNQQNKYLNKPSINIVNGTNALDVAQWKKRKNIDETFHFIGVANLAKWHGYDRLIVGMENYYNDRSSFYDVFFHIIGREGDGSLALLKKYVSKSIIKDYIIFEGEKYGDDLDILFSKCDLAIGSLGMHRISLTNGSTLKAKEYMSRGIPFVIGYHEISIPQDLGFYYSVKADDSPIDIESVIEYLKKGGKPEQMREFALKKLSWESQFEKVIDYFQGET